MNSQWVLLHGHPLSVSDLQIVCQQNSFVPGVHLKSIATGIQGILAILA